MDKNFGSLVPMRFIVHQQQDRSSWIGTLMVVLDGISSALILHMMDGKRAKPRTETSRNLQNCERVCAAVTTAFPSLTTAVN
jgi:hypothetical protein